MFTPGTLVVVQTMTVLSENVKFCASFYSNPKCLNDDCLSKAFDFHSLLSSVNIVCFNHNRSLTFSTADYSAHQFCL